MQIKLKFCLFRLGITQINLSLKTGIGVADISRIITGRLNPTEREKIAIADFLKTTPKALFLELEPIKTDMLKLKLRLWESGKGQLWLSQKTHICTSDISRILNGRMRPTEKEKVLIEGALKMNTTRPQNTENSFSSNNENLLTTEKVAEMLGVCKGFVKKLCKNKALPWINIGIQPSKRPTVRFELKDIIEFKQRHGH